MKKILLIGSTGQVGSSLLKKEQLFPVKIFQLTHKNIDISNIDLLEKFINDIKPDTVINATGYNLVPLAETDTLNAFQVNGIAVAHVANLCYRYKVQFLTFSSDYVFDGTKTSGYTEEDVPNPLQMYGLSKLIGEIGAKNYNPDSVIIRTSMLYGGDGSSVKGNIVLNILNEAKKNDTIEAASNLFSVPTYTEDLAEAVLKLITQDDRISGGIYHLVNEGYCSIEQLAKEIIKIAGLKTNVNGIVRANNSNGVSRPIFSVLINTRAAKLNILMPHWRESLIRYLYELGEIKN